MRLRPISVLLLAALFVAASLASKLNAQTTTSGGLTGVVTDPSHALVPDADVEIKDNTKGTNRSTKTDREGVYRFFFLAPERYTLTVKHAGFRRESRTVNVLLGPPVTVNVTLELATEHTTVNVTGEAPLIQSENGDVSTTIDRQQVAEVPNPGATSPMWRKSRRVRSRIQTSRVWLISQIRSSAMLSTIVLSKPQLDFCGNMAPQWLT
jgi:hypothetical protein